MLTFPKVISNSFVVNCFDYRHAIMNFYIFSCVFLLINIKLMEAHHKISTVIGTEEGLLRGTVQSSFNGKKYLAFKGVPYAKPPIGSLRFKVIKLN